MQMREAELMETQRLEEIRNRKNDEFDRRNMQMRIAKSQLQMAEKKIIARQYSKMFLGTFKRDTLSLMVDLGALRRPQELSRDSIFVPQLYSQIQYDMQTYMINQEQMDEMLNKSMEDISLIHKASIVRELNRRAEIKKNEERKKRDEEDARDRRKEKR